MPPPKVSGPPNPASSMSTMSTLGASSGALAPATIVQSPTDSAMVRPMVPPKLRCGIGSLVRSGLNLPIASCSAAPRLRIVDRLNSATDFIGEPDNVCSTGNRPCAGVTAMTTALPADNACPILSARPLLTRCWMKVPASAPAAAPTAVDASSAGEKRPTASPAPAPQAAPRRPRRLPVSIRTGLPSLSLPTSTAPCSGRVLALARPVRFSKSC